MATEAEPGAPADAPRKSAIDGNAIVLLVFALLVPFVLGGSSTIFDDGDVSWHVAAGRWMIEHGQIPMTDPFSFPAFGHRWIAHEWLGEAVMGAAYNLAGFTGLALLVVLALSALMLVLGLELTRWLRALEVAAILAAVTVVLIPFLHARPMVLAWPFLAFWTVALLHSRERHRPPPLWLALMMLVWVNMHASFALGLLLIGPFALEALIEETDKKGVIIGWGSFGIACLVASLINPNTVTTLLMPIAAFTSSDITLIGEFKPTDMSFTPWFEYSLLFLLALCLLRGTRVAPIRLIVMLLLLHLAFQHMRHQSLFIIVAPLLLAGPLVLGTAAKAMGPSQRRRLAALGVAALLVLFAIRLATPVPVPNSDRNPTAAIAAVPGELRGQRVLNSYSFGGPLILHGIRPYIDGRTDLYGTPFVLDYQAMLEGNARKYAEALQRWNFRWALISTKDRDLLRLIDSDSGWKRIRADRYAVTYVRR
jgi:hypothetical protein